MDTRRMLEKAVGTQLPDVLWQFLVNQEYFSPSCHVSSAEFKELLRMARAQLRLHKAWEASTRAPDSGERSRDETLVIAGSRERALDEYFALQAEQSKRVRRFREDCVGSRVLSYEEAASLLQCRPAAILSPTQLRHLAIPMVFLWSAEIEARPLFAVVRWTEGKARRSAPIRLSTRQREIFPRLVKMLKRDNHPASIIATSQSVLGRLRRVSQWVASQYGWDWYSVRYLLLAGLAPTRESITGDTSYIFRGPLLYPQIELAIDPRTPQTAVLREYARQRSELFETPPRAVSAGLIEVFRFVVAQKRTGSDSSWSSLMKLWNERGFGRTYSDRRRFARDYRRAETALIAARVSDEVLPSFEAMVRKRERSHHRQINEGRRVG
jgi:hypothetical protein